MQTYKEFIQANKVTMTAKPATENKNIVGGENMDHWQVTIRYNGRQMSLPFSQGYGYKGKAPELENVLYCLASDGASVDGIGFEEWAGEFGYDTDSRKAAKTYKVCKAQAAKLRNLLGDELTEELYHETEE